MPAITSPLPQFFDRDGTPLDGGKVWVGLPNLNPEKSAGVAFWDLESTQPAALPLQTANGYICRAGTPALVYTSGDYSLMVRDRQGRQVYYAANSANFELSALVASLRTDISSTATGKGASLVALRDAGGKWVATDLEGFAAEADARLTALATAKDAQAVRLTAAEGTITAHAGRLDALETVADFEAPTAFTPVLVGAAQAGIVTLTGKVVRYRHLAVWSVTITAAPASSWSSAAGSTRISGLPLSPAFPAAFSVAYLAGAFVGCGCVLTDGVINLPSVATQYAVNGPVVLSGSFIIA